jgi:rare lipoprotein A
LCVRRPRRAGWPLLLLVALAACATHRSSLAGPAALGQVSVGIASWYGPGFHGRRTASGERYNQETFTAAHGSLPFGTRVRVTLLATNRSVVVRINDRLPRRDRIIDLSRAAARAIHLLDRGVGKVRVEVIALD